MKQIFTLLLLLVATITKAQNASVALQKNIKYTTAEINAIWMKVPSVINIAFGCTDLRYRNDLPANYNQPTFDNQVLTAWKGEKINLQLLTWFKNEHQKVDVKVSDFKTKTGGVISRKNVKIGFVNYVLTDEFGNGCGHRKPKDFDSSLVADVITDRSVKAVNANSTNPVWVSITIPQNLKEGVYEGFIAVTVDKYVKQLPIRLNVVNKTLADAKKWQFDLDLWQHPAAIARVHDVKLWSDKHFDLMKPYYEMLANAGQKTITASIVDEPWGHQTYDDFPSLIKWTKKKDGTWLFDYSLFDKYITFVESCGIKQKISCYSMVPWKIAFKYYDEQAQKELIFDKAIGTPAYNQFWRTMLVDFTAHLKTKGWFTKTYISMDERPMKAMKDVISLLKSIDKDWKISLAGDYHKEIEKDIDVYCVASRFTFSEQEFEERKNAGKLSTWYTCCTEAYPNLFTFSSPAESAWIGWYTAAKKFDGYLRWAYNSWPSQPLTDSRFTAWPAGDTFMVYPGPYSSIRFEKLREGIQDYEKINTLLSLYQKNGALDKYKQLKEILKSFELKSLETTSAASQLAKFRYIINE